MLALGSALAMLMVGFGVDIVAGDRTDAPDDHQAQGGQDNERATSGRAAEADSASDRNDASDAPGPASAADAEADALLADIDAFLLGDDDETPALHAGLDALEAPDADAPAEEPEDFLAFLDGPDGLFDDEEAAEATDDTDAPVTGDDDISAAFHNDDLFGEHSIEDLFAGPSMPDLDIDDFTPGPEALVFGYDDDGSDPALSVDMEDWDGQRVAAVTIDGEIVARIGLAEGARDMTPDDIALVAEG